MIAADEAREIMSKVIEDDFNERCSMVSDWIRTEAERGGGFLCIEEELSCRVKKVLEEAGYHVVLKGINGVSKTVISWAEAD